MSHSRVWVNKQTYNISVWSGAPFCGWVINTGSRAECVGGLFIHALGPVFLNAKTCWSCGCFSLKEKPYFITKFQYIHNYLSIMLKWECRGKAIDHTHFETYCFGVYLVTHSVLFRYKFPTGLLFRNIRLWGPWFPQTKSLLTTHTHNAYTQASRWYISTFLL